MFTTFKNPGKPMKRTGFTMKAKKPLNQRTSQLKRSGKPMRARRLGKPQRADKYLADLCHGQECYLQIPGHCRNLTEEVVPCHSNQGRDGKAGAMKAEDQYTVPGCYWCHFQIDQAKTFSRAEKFAFWDAAYAKWLPVRARLLEQRKC